MLVYTVQGRCAGLEFEHTHSPAEEQWEREIGCVRAVASLQGAQGCSVRSLLAGSARHVAPPYPATCARMAAT
jgi:methyl coenzyme M reductase gamma subunit